MKSRAADHAVGRRGEARQRHRSTVSSGSGAAAPARGSRCSISWSVASPSSPTWMKSGPDSTRGSRTPRDRRRRSGGRRVGPRAIHVRGSGPRWMCMPETNTASAHWSPRGVAALRVLVDEAYRPGSGRWRPPPAALRWMNARHRGREEPYACWKVPNERGVAWIDAQNAPERSLDE